MIPAAISDALQRAAGTLSSTPPTTSIAPIGTVLTARVDAINSLMKWQAPVMSTPCFADIVLHGHACIRFDGNRQPRMKKCVGCGSPTSLAWHVHPIDFVVPGCSGEHVADAIEKMWGDVFCLRVTGDQARAMVHKVEAAA